MADGRRRIVFATTPKMSTYLFVLVAGELERLTGEAEASKTQAIGLAEAKATEALGLARAAGFQAQTGAESATREA